MLHLPLVIFFLLLKGDDNINAKYSYIKIYTLALISVLSSYSYNQSDIDIQILVYDKINLLPNQQYPV